MATESNPAPSRQRAAGEDKRAQKVVLVTGVSSGFGKEISCVLAEAGHRVYGTVREKMSMDGNIRLLKMDLIDHQSVEQAVSDLVNAEGKIDVLINNAGMHMGGPIETSPMEFVKLQMGTNFIGMVDLTKMVLPHMRKQGGGMIINISSIGGLIGLPYQAFYSSSKFAIEGFSEALRMEVRSFNIKVVIINPGSFRTNNAANRRNFLAPTGAQDPYHEQYRKTLAAIENDGAKGWAPEVLAGTILQIIGKENPRNRYVIASAGQKLTILLKVILPGKWFAKILSAHYRIS